jgi:hypothetical protein
MGYVPYTPRYFNRKAGFLLPRLTTAQRDAIDTGVSAYGGWLVYNTDTNIIEALTPNGWVPAATLVTDLTGSGAVVLQTAPTIESPTLTGTVAGVGTIPNSVLANSSVTIAGHTVSLGETQAISASDLSNARPAPAMLFWPTRPLSALPRLSC